MDQRRKDIRFIKQNWITYFVVIYSPDNTRIRIVVLQEMRRVLEKASFKLLVLVGDIYQIESIYFGNWFSIAQKFVPETSIFELTHPYRTTNNDLLTVSVSKGTLRSYYTHYSRR